LHCPLALDQPAFEETLDNVGERRSIDACRPHEIGLAEALMLGDGDHNRILAGRNIEVSGFDAENFRRPLACAMKEVNNRPVHRSRAGFRVLFPRSFRLAEAFFSIQHDY
jgi:hypothetical protein